MSAPISVDDSALTAHASHLREAAEQIRTGERAIQSVRLDYGAYGLTCQFLVGILDGGTQATVDGLMSSVAGIRRLAHALEQALGLYAEADERAANYLPR